LLLSQKRWRRRGLAVPIIHPTFFPDVGKWRSGHMWAPSIRELLVLLGPGYVCQDYYPEGTPWHLLPHGLLQVEGSVRVTQRKQSRQYARQEVVRAPKPPKPPVDWTAEKTHQRPIPEDLEPIFPPGKERDEAVLNGWAEGLSQTEIAIKLQCKVNCVAGVLSRKRTQGDPRAAPRSKARVPAHYATV
jgi:hypothetical protein